MSIDDRDYFREDAVRRANYTPKSFRQPQGEGSPGEGTFKDSKQISWAAILVLVVSLLVVLYFSHVFKNLPIIQEQSVSPPVVYQAPVENASRMLQAPIQAPIEPARVTEVEFPPSGIVRYYEPVDPSKLSSPVIITSSPGHDFMRVVRIISAHDNRTFVDAYIRPGRSMEVWIPAGLFRTESFIGHHWLGPDKLFADRQYPAPPDAPFVSEIGSRYTLSFGAPMLVENSPAR
jgi:hypothetical protein